eukprot:comp21231_c0_seq1/m.28905 comp21231_c0_seq1/g.28905  ORF comp21231_c0_seq1/g.28905 comp21231_c0_seq1/m.28905 type:complete len:592 (-) comp21231_c0_seq1:54-1829(-)
MGINDKENRAPVMGTPQRKTPVSASGLVCTTPRGTPIRPKTTPRSISKNSHQVLEWERELEQYQQKIAELKAKIEGSTHEVLKDLNVNVEDEHAGREIIKDLMLVDKMHNLSLMEEDEVEVPSVQTVYYDHNEANYSTIERVGKGSFGVCHLVEHKRTGQRLCRKTINLCQKDMDMTDARGECTFLNRIVNTHCLKLFDLHINPNMELFIYMEYCPWSLESLRLVRGAKLPPQGAVRDRLDVSTVLHAAYQTLKGLDYLANFGRYTPGETDKTLRIVHTDIKSDNLLISFDGTVKIADFGISVLLKGDEKITDEIERGSEAYMAPEVKKSLPYWEPADMYSLGASIYEMITGHLPTGRAKPTFWGKVEGLLSQACSGEGEARHVLLLLQTIMRTDPDDRPTPRDLLESKFFKDFDQTESQEAMLRALEKGEELYQSYLTFRAECEKKGAENFIEISSSSAEEESESSFYEEEEEEEEEEKEESEGEEEEEEESEIEESEVEETPEKKVKAPVKKQADAKGRGKTKEEKESDESEYEPSEGEEEEEGGSDYETPKGKGKKGQVQVKRVNLRVGGRKEKGESEESEEYETEEE